MKRIALQVPVQDELTQRESIGLGLRQEMITIDDGDVHGSVTVGAGLGSDSIILEWKGRRAVVRGRDLLRAWMMRFAPGDAKRLP